MRLRIECPKCQRIALIRTRELTKAKRDYRQLTCTECGHTWVVKLSKVYPVRG